MLRITANTGLVGVVGNPVRHSLSPALHNAAYAALRLDWAYLAFEVPIDGIGAAVAGAQALGVRGLSVTMPFKSKAAALATRRSQAVRKLGAANTLTFEGNEVVADTTDGEGLVADLQKALRFDPAGRRCAVIGAGGAGRAVVLALADAGAAEILVANRSPVGAFKAASLAPHRARPARAEEVLTAELVVQATPFGMGEDLSATPEADSTERALPPDPRWPAGVDPGRLGPGQIAVDLVYHPAETRWLGAASAGGATTRNGLGLLVHQAALQVERWTGRTPPFLAMWAAVSLSP